MSINLYEAAKLSQNQLARGVMLAIATSDEMTSQIPMLPKVGEAFVYNREKTLATAEFVAPDHASITESATTFDRVTVPLRLLVTDVDVYDFVEEQMGDTNAQKATQLSKKLKSVGRLIADKAINGAFSSTAVLSPAAGSPGAALGGIVPGPLQDSDRNGPGSIRYTHTGTFWAYRAPGDRTFGANVAVTVNTNSVVLSSDNPNRKITVNVTVASATADGEIAIRFTTSTNEPDGLNKLITTAQTIASTGVDGDELSFSVLDRMIDESVKVRENLRFVVNGKLKRKYYALLRAMGGAAPEHVSLPGISGQVPMYRGIPILQNDWIGSSEAKGALTTLSSAYLIAFGEEGLFAGVGSGGNTLNVDADPRQVRVAGIKIRDVGELEGKEAQRTRVSWYGAFGLGSELSAARATQIKTV